MFMKLLLLFFNFLSFLLLRSEQTSLQGNNKAAHLCTWRAGARENYLLHNARDKTDTQFCVYGFM